MSATPTSVPKRALPTGKVGARYGVCARSVLRWEVQKVLPKADLIINKRRCDEESCDSVTDALRLAQIADVAC